MPEGGAAGAGGIPPYIQIQDITKLLPNTFTGEHNQCPLLHTTKFLDYLEYQKVAEEAANHATIINRFKYTLSGTAREWLDRAIETHANDWIKIKDDFKLRFNKMGSSKDELKLKWKNLTLQRGEGIHNFKDRVISLGKALSINNDEILTEFRNCLPYEVYHNVMNIASIDEAADVANRIILHKTQHENEKMINIPVMSQIHSNEISQLTDRLDKITDVLNSHSETLQLKSSNNIDGYHGHNNRNGYHNNRRNFKPRSNFQRGRGQYFRSSQSRERNFRPGSNFNRDRSRDFRPRQNSGRYDNFDRRSQFDRGARSNSGDRNRHFNSKPFKKERRCFACKSTNHLIEDCETFKVAMDKIEPKTDNSQNDNFQSWQDCLDFVQDDLNI